MFPEIRAEDVAGHQTVPLAVRLVDEEVVAAQVDDRTAVVDLIDDHAKPTVGCAEGGLSPGARGHASGQHRNTWRARRRSDAREADLEFPAVTMLRRDVASAGRLL